MFVDYDNPTLTSAVVVFPDHVFPDVPKSPSQVLETVTIRGTDVSSTSIRGEVDNPSS